MDLNVLEVDTYVDEDSGSVYEKSSESPSHDEDAGPGPSSTSNLNRKRSKSSPRKPGDTFLAEKLRSSANRSSADIESPIFEDAAQWASRFRPPDLEEIQTPIRGRRKRRSISQKPAANEARVKRLKQYYSNSYREILNVDIQHTLSREIDADRYRLKGSQIGSSIWTSAEKEALFVSISRMGRDNAPGIADRIGSKSELEVEEYIQLLDQGLKERRLQRSHHNELLAPTELPAANEISGECCILLERAGDYLAARQDLEEEKVEKGKWGDMWLLNQYICRQIDQRRREEGGEEEMDEVLPAANLFNVKNWIELSQRVFMNPNSTRVEDQWQNIAEPGETPAIRATAIEDFHSLAVSITKRLLSTTLFCTMSRLRARASNKIKHSEVNSDDVEAAINILGLKRNCSEFWIKCARRCSLEVVNDDSHSHEENEAESGNQSTVMTYAEVEAALQSSIRPRSRSRSTSQREQSRQPAAILVHPSRPSTASSVESPVPLKPQSPLADYESSDEGDTDSLTSFGLSEELSLDLPHSELSTSHPQRALKLAQDRQAAEREQDAEIEAFDMQASKEEELRLWNILKASPPFEIKPEAVRSEERPKVQPLSGELVEMNWRERTEYWSQWETLETPVPEEAFRRNNRRRSRKAKRRERTEALGEDHLLSDDRTDEDAEFQNDSDNDQEEPMRTVEDSEESDNDFEEDSDASNTREFLAHQSILSDNPTPTRFETPAEDFRISDDEMIIKMEE